jgi:hypothetical protein
VKQTFLGGRCGECQRVDPTRTGELWAARTILGLPRLAAGRDMDMACLLYNEI